MNPIIAIVFMALIGTLLLIVGLLIGYIKGRWDGESQVDLEKLSEIVRAKLKD